MKFLMAIKDLESKVNNKEDENGEAAGPGAELYEPSCSEEGEMQRGQALLLFQSLFSVGRTHAQ